MWVAIVLRCENIPSSSHRPPGLPSVTFIFFYCKTLFCLQQKAYLVSVPPHTLYLLHAPSTSSMQLFVTRNRHLSRWHCTAPLMNRPENHMSQRVDGNFVRLVEIFHFVNTFWHGINCCCCCWWFFCLFLTIKTVFNHLWWAFGE